MRTTTQDSVLQAIREERERQEQGKTKGRFKFTCADAEMSHHERNTVLSEEVGEVAEAILTLDGMAAARARGLKLGNEGHENLREELTQVAAVAVAWLEALPAPRKCPTCGSPHPERHPAVQFEGEVQPCADPWHGPHAAASIPPALDADECESCDDTGIYEEGSEWAPCEECERGKRFAECLRTFAREHRPALDAEARERLRRIAIPCAERWDPARKEDADFLRHLAASHQPEPQTRTWLESKDDFLAAWENCERKLTEAESQQEETWRAEDEAAHQQAIKAQLSTVQQQAQRWTIWKLRDYGSGVRGPDTEPVPGLTGVEAVRSAEVEVMPVAECEATVARLERAKAALEEIGRGMDGTDRMQPSTPYPGRAAMRLALQALKPSTRWESRGDEQQG